MAMQGDARHLILPGAQLCQPSCGQLKAPLAEPASSQPVWGEMLYPRGVKVISPVYRLSNLG